MYLPFRVMIFGEPYRAVPPATSLCIDVQKLLALGVSSTPEVQSEPHV